MNKTISINLGGIVFNIEENAYNQLRSYLERIKLNFQGDAGENEIMSDIEGRIAELFQNRLSESKNVVETRDVQDVISIMGQPEDYAIHSNSPETSATQESSAEPLRNKNRRIYRDLDDAVIGGVCAGFSHNLGWDPLILRILAVLALILSFGIALLVYIILWALVPAARTTAEKLQMQGEAVTVENIRKYVNDEKRSGEATSGDVRHAGRRRPNHAESFFRTLGMVFTKLFGVLFVILGLLILFGLTGGMIAADINIFGGNPLHYDLVDRLIFTDAGSLTLSYIGVILVAGVPAILLLYAGIKLLFGVKKRVPGLTWSLFGLFVVGVVICSVEGIRVGRQYSRHAEDKSVQSLELAPADTLFIAIGPDLFPSSGNHHGPDFFDLIQIEDSVITYGEPVRLWFDESPDEQVHIIVRRQSEGPSTMAAGQYTSHIRYNYSIGGNRATFDPYFRTPGDEPYRGQEVEIEVRIPNGRKVHFDDNIGRITWYEEYAGKTLLYNDGFDRDEDEYDDETKVILHTPHVEVTTREGKDSTVVKVGGIEIRTTKE